MRFSTRALPDEADVLAPMGRRFGFWRACLRLLSLNSAWPRGR